MADDWGIDIWGDDGSLWFASTDFSGRYVGTLNFTGPADGVFTVPDKPPESELYIVVNYFNVEPDQFAQAIVIIINGNQINYNLSNLAATAETSIDYGFR